MILAVQALSLGLELTALFLLARWGWQLDAALPLRLLTAVATPVIAAACWGRWAAPRSPLRLPDPARFGFELLFYAVVCLALLFQGQERAAAVFGSVVALQLAASFALQLRGP